MSIDQGVPSAPSSTPTWAVDLKGRSESANWDQEGKLRGQEEKNQLLWLKGYGWVVMSFLLVFTLLYMGALVSWALHYLLNDSLHWLTPEQLSKIQSILFSGSVGGVVSLVLQKQLKK